jgi:multicomponent Na+:H+ antiporter subunit E
VWLIIAGGDLGSLLLGVPAIAFATWASIRVTPIATNALSLPGLVRFIGYFLRESLRGGIDVARRTLGPTLRINPGFLEYHCALPPGRPRVLFANCVSLLPGTLTAELHGETLTLHLLDTGAAVADDLEALERTIGGLFVQRREESHA